MRKRFMSLAFVFGAATVAAATACGGGSSDQEDRQLALTQELVPVSEQVHTRFDASAGQLASIDSQLTEAEKRLEAFKTSAVVSAIGRTDGIPEPPAGKVALRFSFEYPQGTLPGDGIVVHEPQPDVNTVWAMESLPKGEAVPVGSALQDSTLFLAPGETTTVTLVYKNPTPSEIGWLALPHQESPGSLHTKTWLTCFCLSFVWKAPAEGSWYRVIGVRLSPDMPAGSKIDARWTVLTDPSVFPES